MSTAVVSSTKWLRIASELWLARRATFRDESVGKGFTSLHTPGGAFAPRWLRRHIWTVASLHFELQGVCSGAICGSLGWRLRQKFESSVSDCVALSLANDCMGMLGGGVP